MGHDHDAAGGGHAGHSHDTGASTKRLAIALGLTTAFLIAELVGAFVFDSLALLSDAAHMFTDSAALAIALAAIDVLKSLLPLSTRSYCLRLRAMC